MTNYFEGLADDFVLPQPIGYMSGDSIRCLREGFTEEWTGICNTPFQNDCVPVYLEELTKDQERSLQQKRLQDLEGVEAVVLPSHDYLRRMISVFYEINGNNCGGKLHIVLDDYNLEDEHIIWCRETYPEDNDMVFIANLLLQYPYNERVEAVKHWYQKMNNWEGY